MYTVTGCASAIRKMAGVTRATWNNLVASVVSAKEYFLTVHPNDLATFGVGLEHAPPERDARGRSEVGEHAAMWMHELVQQIADHDPTHAGVVFMDVMSIKEMHAMYVEDVVAEAGEGAKVLGYNAFYRIWRTYCKGDYFPGQRSPKVVVCPHNKSTGHCADCVELRMRRRGASTEAQRQYVDNQIKQHVALAWFTRQNYWLRRELACAMVAAMLTAILSINLDKLDHAKTYWPKLVGGPDSWGSYAGGMMPFSLFCAAVHGYKAMWFIVLAWVLMTDNLSGSVTVTMLMHILA
eukprot:5094096-Prorocentrum_lima.AAC.1